LKEAVFASGSERLSPPVSRKPNLSRPAHAIEKAPRNNVPHHPEDERHPHLPLVRVEENPPRRKRQDLANETRSW
jgi:hypothetical protein